MHIEVPPDAAGVSAPLPRGLWATIRAAVRGARIDYTTAPVGQAVIMLAVPMVMEMAMESIFAVADVFWVAHLGADAVATVGLTESMMTIIYTAAMGLSIGATALVARRTGEHDPDGAARAAGQSILLGLGIAAAIALLAAPFAPSLLRLMGATEEVVRTGSGFTRLMLAGNATVLLLFLQNAVFRGAGDAAIAMRVLILGNLLNIVLGPCFIFGIGPFPRLGVTGAAVATNVGRGAAVLYQFWMLTRGTGRVQIARRHLRLDLPMMRSVLTLSGSGTFQILIGSASYIGLVRILSTFGSAALAGYTIGIRVIIFALLPAFGISNAAATMVGQNLGARRPDRAEAAVWTAARYNMVFLGGVGLLFLIAAPQIAASLHGRCGGAAVRGVVPAHRQPGVPVLRGRDGADRRLQRRRRYLDADPDQPGRVLAVRDSTRVVAGDADRARTARRVLGADDRLLRAGGRERRLVPPREVEGAGDLSA